MEDRIVFGPALIPGLKIYRNPSESIPQPHYIVFAADNIALARQKFHAKGYDNRVNLNHDGIQVSNVILIDSFLISDSNRQTLQKEFQDLPNGTWMVSYQVDNDEVWSQIKNRKLNGFSIEGNFTLELLKPANLTRRRISWVTVAHYFFDKKSF